MEANAILLVWLGCLKDGLVNVGVEFLRRFRGVEALQSVLLERVDEDGIRHLDAVVESNEVGIVRLELLLGDGTKGAIEVVDRLDEIASEALNGKVFCALDFALSTLLEVAEVGDRAEVFVLLGRVSGLPLSCIHTSCGGAYLQFDNFLVLLLYLLLQLCCFVLLCRHVLLLLSCLALLGWCSI